MMTRSADWVVLSVVAGCIAAGPCVEAPFFLAAAQSPIAPTQHDTAALALAHHVVNRLTFGARPADAEKVWSVGVARWIEEQLSPDSVPDRSGQAVMRFFPIWTAPIDSARRELSVYGVTQVPDGNGGVVVQLVIHPLIPRTRAESKDSAGRVPIQVLRSQELLAGRFARAEFSERQLLEVMTDFWNNHFSIYAPLPDEMLDYDRSVIRPNALGRFRDLLGAVARHPAMLRYLNNAQNKVGAINENYARELLELHTMGADGGFTQSDVIAAAKALTGWTIEYPPMPTELAPTATPRVQRTVPAVFSFARASHDFSQKQFLGYMLDGKNEQSEGEILLDIVARHPSTAMFISRKLAQRFVSDEPPDALVATAAATFTSTDGNIREVVRTILTSTAFRDPARYNSKLKSPHEFLLSVRRALGLPVDTTGVSIDILVKLGQPMFGKVLPNGYPEVSTSWYNVGAFKARIDFISDLARGKIPEMPVTSTLLWRNAVNQQFAVQMNAVLTDILGGRAGPETRQAMQNISSVRSSRERLKELLIIALGSSEFQRR